MSKESFDTLRGAIERAFGIELKTSRTTSRTTARAISDLAARRLDHPQFGAVISLVDALGDETRVLLERQKRQFKKTLSHGVRIIAQELPGRWYIQCHGVRLSPGEPETINVEADGPTLPEALENLAKALSTIAVAKEEKPTGAPSAAPEIPAPPAGDTDVKGG
jgi:hypothetical protein